MSERLPSTLKAVAVGAAVADSRQICYGPFGYGSFQVPAASGLTSLTWYFAVEDGGTYLPHNDATGGATVQAVVAGQGYEIPAELRGCRWLKVVGNVAGTLDLSLKS